MQPDSISARDLKNAESPHAESSKADLLSQTQNCYHGGAFFEAIGSRLDAIARHDRVINADVLDAWFPPAPGVIEAIAEHLPWLARTSPPTHCEGMIETLAEVRQIAPAHIVAGSGSSDLIFRAFTSWLKPGSRVLMLDPCYGEYAHVCEQVLGCEVHRHALAAHQDFRIDTEALAVKLRQSWDLVVLIHPNNPTGQHLDRAEMEKLVRMIPTNTRCWIDEAYIEYVGSDQSLESVAAASSHIFVCKSLSKVYALSGMRVAYLVGPQKEMQKLRMLTPPWAVSLPGQLAGIRALKDPQYYAQCYQKTHQLREELATGLSQQFPGSTLIKGVANWVLWNPPIEEQRIQTWVDRCRDQGLFLRTFPDADHPLKNNTIRIAVKDAPTQKRILEILQNTQP